MEVKMLPNMEIQFQKLKNILDQVSKFYFGLNTKEYVGPVNPTSIVSLVSNSGLINVNFFVLAEGVPGFYLPFDFGSSHLDAVTVYLDENFEFRDYDPVKKELRQLSVLIGDKEYSYDGTVKAANAYFENEQSTLKVLC
jgi:hypothetical protein